MGLFEDALTHHAIGINGMAKTVVGFLAASVGVRIDVENHTIRLMLNFLLSLLSSGLYIFVNRFLLGLAEETDWMMRGVFGDWKLGDCVDAFPFLDRLQVRD